MSSTAVDAPAAAKLLPPQDRELITERLHAALWALPLVLLASGLAPSLPRLRWAFYWFYPLHLVAFWLLLRAW